MMDLNEGGFSHSLHCDAPRFGLPHRATAWCRFGILYMKEAISMENYARHYFRPASIVRTAIFGELKTTLPSSRRTVAA